MKFPKMRPHRKSGVSLESVMLGLVIVLTFAALIYSGYGLMRTYLDRQHYDRVGRMVVSEMFLLANQGPPPGFQIGEQRQNTTQLIIDSGAVVQNGYRDYFGRNVINGPDGSLIETYYMDGIGRITVSISMDFMGTGNYWDEYDEMMERCHKWRAIFNLPDEFDFRDPNSPKNVTMWGATPDYGQACINGASSIMMSYNIRHIPWH